jgi:hypothetical protein
MLAASKSVTGNDDCKDVNDDGDNSKQINYIYILANYTETHIPFLN